MKTRFKKIHDRECVIFYNICKSFAAILESSFCIAAMFASNISKQCLQGIFPSNICKPFLELVFGINFCNAAIFASIFWKQLLDSFFGIIGLSFWNQPLVSILGIKFWNHFLESAIRISF